jgi:hypothetical protein
MRVLYVLEDQAHAQFVPRLFRRIAEAEGVDLDNRELTPMGGAGRTIGGLRQLLADVRAGSIAQPDAIVVGIDADCGTQGERAQQVRRACELEQYAGSVLTAEPDPHIEIWYVADPNYVQQLLQTPDRPPIPNIRCRKQEYKDRLRSIVRSSGDPTPLGGVEYGPEIAAGMDLYDAGRNVASLRRFVDDARSFLRARA